MITTSWSRLPLAEAEKLSAELVELLSPVCVQLVVCGSIRRKADTAGDIDLVCEPQYAESLDIFGEPIATVDTLAVRCDNLERDGVLAKRRDRNGRSSWGPALKRAVFRNLPVDIQIVTDPDVWGAWVLVRTGPADFNKRVVTPMFHGGWLPKGMKFRDGFQLWRGDSRIPTPTEEDVFRALSLQYIRPEDRR